MFAVIVCDGSGVEVELVVEILLMFMKITSGGSENGSGGSGNGRRVN